MGGGVDVGVRARFRSLGSGIFGGCNNILGGGFDGGRVRARASAGGHSGSTSSRSGDNRLHGGFDIFRAGVGNGGGTNLGCCNNRLCGAFDGIVQPWAFVALGVGNVDVFQQADHVAIGGVGKIDGGLDDGTVMFGGEDTVGDVDPIPVSGVADVP